MRGLYLLALAYAARSAPKTLPYFEPLLKSVLDCFDEHTAVRYTDAVADLSPEAQTLLEPLMRPYKEEPYEYKSKFFRPAYLTGKDEGKAEGKTEGMLAGQRAALKRLICRKHALSPHAERMIDAANTTQLERWLDAISDGAMPRELGEE